MSWVPYSVGWPGPSRKFLLPWGSGLTSSSAVPGELRGLEYIHQKYGKLPWASTMQPAIKLARDGFVISEDFGKAMDLSEKFVGWPFLSDDPIWAVDFAPNGTRLGHGDLMTRKRYARTLETVARLGTAAFYRGPMAEHTIEMVQKSNGTMAMKDLEDYSVRSRMPVKIDYNGYQIYACGAPASGSVTLSALKILEQYKDSAKDLNYLHIHRMTEAIRFGYGKVSACVPCIIRLVSLHF